MSLTSTKFSRSLLRISLSLPDCTKIMVFSCTTDSCHHHSYLYHPKTQQNHTLTLTTNVNSTKTNPKILPIQILAVFQKNLTAIYYEHTTTESSFDAINGEARDQLFILSKTHRHPKMGFLLDIFISYEHKCAYFVLSRTLNVVIKSSTLKQCIQGSSFSLSIATPKKSCEI